MKLLPHKAEKAGALMRVSILVPDDHPVFPYLKAAIERLGQDHDIRFCHDVSDLPSAGDLLFMISWPKLVKAETRGRFKHALVVHASDLPEGKGWSPLVWQILEGKNDIAITLFEAVDDVDAGDIWKKDVMSFEGHELADEINDACFRKTAGLISFAIEHAQDIKPRAQDDKDGTTYYRKRTPEDSALDPEKTIAEQFDLLRVCDPERYPAYFEYRGHRYTIKLDKQSTDTE